MYPKHVAQLVNTDAAVVILVEQFKQLPIGLHLRTIHWSEPDRELNSQ